MTTTPSPERSSTIRRRMAIAVALLAVSWLAIGLSVSAVWVADWIAGALS